MDKQRLSELIRDGKTHAEIAIIFGCTRPSVSIAAKKLGLVPVKRRKEIDVQLLRHGAMNGISFSEFARQHGHTIGAVSVVAKKHNILPPGDNHLQKALPDQEIYKEYIDDKKSLDFLHKKYSVPVALIKRHLRKIDHKLIFRTMDQAKRPSLLNDAKAFAAESDRKSYRSIARELGVKIKTVTDAARRFNLAFPFKITWSKIEHEKLLEMYLERLMTPSMIAREMGYPYGVVLRQLRGSGFKIADAGGTPHPSKHWQLNDKDWLEDQYLIKLRSINELSIEIETTPRNVLHHLRKHGIKTRSRSEYIPLLMQKRHGEKIVYRGLACDSQLEREFLRSLPSDATVEKSVELKYAGSDCWVDFSVDGNLVEVKPASIITDIGVDRRRAVKQLLVCQKNNRQVKIWTKAGYWDQTLTDDDKYYAMNWKLFFDTSIECADWLLNYGFRPPAYSTFQLIDAVGKMAYCKVGCELNANFQNGEPAKLTQHFFPHFWMSTHKDYISPAAAWQIGNRTVLRKAVDELWARNSEVHIYGLLKHITKKFKDFAVVSLFKPWIASYVYDKYLPDGGVVVDPSCGWGGRFMAAVEKEIKYIGYDLNINSINSHKSLCEFLGGRVIMEPKFIQADSSTCQFADGDLLFTSPPYDDTELYYGIDSLKTKTKPILDNIFSQFRKTIVLNVPRRQEEECLVQAEAHGKKLVDRLEMKTSSFMGREKTFEPILVFK